MKKRSTLILLLLLLALLAACGETPIDVGNVATRAAGAIDTATGGDGDPTSPSEPTPEPPSEPTPEPPSDVPSNRWAGMTADNSMLSLSNVKISINGVETQSDGNGNFELSVPRADDNRYVINAELDGYLPVSQIHIGSAMESLTLEFQPVERFTVDPAQPIAVEDSGGTQINIGADQLVDENGNPPAGDVTLNMYTYDLENEEMVGDMSGTNSDGEPVYMESEGAFYASFEDDAGAEYNLADGATAEVSIPCEPRPDETLTVWSYDPNTGLWVEEGPVVIEGERCSAEVSHFSYWNFDYEKRTPSCIKLEVEQSYLAENTPLNVQAVLQTNPTRVIDLMVSEQVNVLINLPNNTDVKFYKAPDYTNAFATTNSGAAWGGTGVPAPPYTVCNGQTDIPPSVEATPLILQSVNYPERYLAVNTDGTAVELVPVSPGSDDALKQRATFMQVPGLADASMVSLQTNNGAYVVATPDGVTLQAMPDTDELRRAATFNMVDGLAGTGVSFESLAHLGYYLRHSGFVLRLDKSDGSDLYNQDASYNGVADFVAVEPQMGTLNGQVVDIDSNEPLTGAQVCVQGTEQCATVGDDGSYSLSDLNPADLVFEVTATDYITAVQTITLAAGETLALDFALTAENPILAVLPDNVVLRGALANIISGGEATVEIGSTFTFEETNAGISVPNYGVTAGDLVLVAVINQNAEFLVPNRSETELGKAAGDQLESATFEVVTVGNVNQPLMLDDQMEVVLTDPSSSNPPYTVNIYRGEGGARELIATFTINKQQ